MELFVDFWIFPAKGLLFILFLTFIQNLSCYINIQHFQPNFSCQFNFAGSLQIIVLIIIDVDFGFVVLSVCDQSKTLRPTSIHEVAVKQRFVVYGDQGHGTVPKCDLRSGVMILDLCLLRYPLYVLYVICLFRPHIVFTKYLAAHFSSAGAFLFCKSVVQACYFIKL